MKIKTTLTSITLTIKMINHLKSQRSKVKSSMISTKRRIWKVQPNGKSKTISFRNKTILLVKKKLSIIRRLLSMMLKRRQMTMN